jgi:hypothetical protein
MAITFNGPSKTITLAAGQTTVSVAEMYSRWKDWVMQSDNAKYLDAFRVVGGDPLGGGVFATINVFIRNDYGWRIKPPEQDIDIVLVGNLYPEDPLQPWRAPTTGDFHTSINTNLSMNLIEFDSGGGGGGTVTVNAEEIADAVWNRAMSDHATAGTFGRRLRELLPPSIRRR